MIQLTEAGLICTSNIENLADIFSSDHVVRLPQLVKASVLKSIMRCVAAGEWRPFSHWEMSKELVLVDQAAVHALKFVANTPDFLKLIERVTGCGSISNFHGRVYRMYNDPEHFDNWHNDCANGRLVGMSLNVGSDCYSGGVFQLRRKGSEEILVEAPNNVPGDAIVFRISREFQHRVTEVTSSDPKTAFAGWFRSYGSSIVSTLRWTGLRDNDSEQQ